LAKRKKTTDVDISTEARGGGEKKHLNKPGDLSAKGGNFSAFGSRPRGTEGTFTSQVTFNSTHQRAEGNLGQ